MKKSGFTLPEMLVVIGVLSVAGFLVLNIFTNALRGSNKSQILSSIKKNGQTVLETLDKDIRNSDNLVCISSPSSLGFVIFKDGTYIRYRFIQEAPSVNGQIQKDNPKKKTVSGSNPQREETDTEFILRVCPETSPMSAPDILTDTDLQTGASISCLGQPANCTLNPIFKKDISPGFKAQITIKFLVKPPISAPSSVSGQIDPVEFATTVGLR